MMWANPLFLCYREPGAPRDVGSKRLQQTQAQVDEVRLPGVAKSTALGLKKIDQFWLIEFFYEKNIIFSYTHLFIYNTTKLKNQSYIFMQGTSYFHYVTSWLLAVNFTDVSHHWLHLYLV